MKISIVILVQNEDSTKVLHLMDSIKHVAVGEFVIVCTSKTPNFAPYNSSEHKVVFIHKPQLAPDFSVLRNFADSKCSFDYILHIDSDELPKDELISELQKIEMNNCAYKIRRKDKFWGKLCVNGELKNAATQGILRFYPKDAGTWSGAIHERYLTSICVKTLQNGYLLHESHKGITDFISKINLYSSIRANELYGKESKITALFKLILYPPLKFIKTYFIDRGYLDAEAGFVYSFMMSFHSFLVRGKLLNKIYNVK